MNTEKIVWMIIGLLLLVKCHEEAEAHATYLDLKICF